MLINKRDLSIFRKTFVFKVTACKMLKILILHSAIIQRSTFSQASLILSLFKFIISQSPLCCLVPFVPFTAFFQDFFVFQPVPMYPKCVRIGICFLILTLILVLTLYLILFLYLFLIDSICYVCYTVCSKSGICYVCYNIINHGIPQPFSVPVYHIMEFDVLSCFICLISSQLSVFAQLFSVHSDAIDRIMIRRI